MKNIQIILCLIFISFSTLIIAQTSDEKHVLLIGIDGVSAEGFQYANTPNINELIKIGAISIKTRGVMPTVSSPNWESILCGAGPEQHGVTSNDWMLTNQAFGPIVKDMDGYFPSIFTIIKNQMPKAVTTMFYDWEGLGRLINTKNINTVKCLKTYTEITSQATEFIKSQKPLFTFVYYEHPDEVGHKIGHGTTEYFQSITTIDGEVGKLVKALKEAGIYETTTILIVSDHGGIGKGHGGESKIEIEVPWIIAGPGIVKNCLLQKPNDGMNTSATIAKILGLKIPEEWIGHANSEAFVSENKNKTHPEYVQKPFCNTKEDFYTTPQIVELTTQSSGNIYYTLDGSCPTKNANKYNGKFTISDNCTLKAISIKGNNSSEIITANYSFLKGIKSVKLTTEPSAKYKGYGALGLFNRVVGTSNYKDKEWLGWEVTDFEASIDLGALKTINNIGIDALNMPSAWIFLPAKIEFYISDNGIDYKIFETLIVKDSDKSQVDGLVLLSKQFNNTTARYIKVKAINLGTCPKGHVGEGDKAWLFISEIEIK